MASSLRLEGMYLSTGQRQGSLYLATMTFEASTACPKRVIQCKSLMCTLEDAMSIGGYVEHAPCVRLCGILATREECPITPSQRPLRNYQNSPSESAPIFLMPVLHWEKEKRLPIKVVLGRSRAEVCCSTCISVSLVRLL